MSPELSDGEAGGGREKLSVEVGFENGLSGYLS